MSSELLETPVKSPCVSVCALDEQDVCLGCYRTVDEIREWSSVNDAQRREIIRMANARCKERYG